MTSKPPTVFITSATGITGSALCRILLDTPFNYTIRSTTRNPSSAAAKALSSLGVQFIGAYREDNTHPTSVTWSSSHEETLLSALKPCSKLFLCLLPNLADLTEAPRQAAMFARQAKEAGITQVVVMTSLGVSMLGNEAIKQIKYPHPPSDVFGAHLQAQAQIEDIVISAGFESWTVLRPGFFMANFLEPKISTLHGGYSEIRDSGRWTTCLTPESKLGLVDHVDIARLVAAAFEDPVGFGGKKLGVVSDVLGVQDVLDVLRNAVNDVSANGGSAFHGLRDRNVDQKFKAVFVGGDEDDVTDFDLQLRGLQGNCQRTARYYTPKAGFFTTEKCLRYMLDGVDLEEPTKLLAGSRLFEDACMTDFEGFLRRETKAVGETYLLVRH
ncbi:hypothetical protein V8F20_011134 [Naviculisporaceae sp. PSN 640]